MEVQILSLIVALLAVIVGPYVTYLITKKNLEFQFRTLIQEKWVTKLEDAAHSFLNSSSEWISKYPMLQDGSWEVKEPNKEIDRMLDSINSSIIKLEFLLDIEKENQALILEKVASMTSIIHSKVYDENSLSTLRKNHDTIISMLQKIFHEERTKMAKVFRKVNKRK